MCSRPTNLYKDVDAKRPVVPYTQLAALIFSVKQHTKTALGWVVLTPRVQGMLWVSCTTNNTTTEHVVFKLQLEKHFTAMQNDNCLHATFVHDKHELPRLTDQRTVIEQVECFQ